MKKAPFFSCSVDGHTRQYTAVENETGDISVHYGHVAIPNPSELLLSAAAIALQKRVPGLNTAEVVLLDDRR